MQKLVQTNREYRTTQIDRALKMDDIDTVKTSKKIGIDLEFIRFFFSNRLVIISLA